MANIKEIRDAGPNPNSPSVEEMRRSQERGSKGIAFNEQSLNDSLADNNHAPDTTGKHEDKTSSKKDSGHSGLAFLGQR